MEPIDLQFLGYKHAIGVYLVETPGGPALLDCGPATTVPRLKEGLRERGLELTDVRHLLLSHIHLDHAGGVGTILRENPELTVWVSEVGAPHLVEPSRLEASARRLYGDSFDRLFAKILPVPASSIRIADGDVLGWDAFATPGHASHHVCYLKDGTLFAGDACGVRVQPSEYVLPVAPPPDIDIEAWHASIDEIERRQPELLAPTHFGVADDIAPHLERLRSELDRWAGLVGTGIDAATFAAAVMPAAGSDGGMFDEIAPYDMSWKGLRRYWEKREPATGEAAR